MPTTKSSSIAVYSSERRFRNVKDRHLISVINITPLFSDLSPVDDTNT